MVSVAVGWQVYDLTRRPLDLGLVGLVQFLPTLFLWPITGVTADRHPRLRIVQAAATTWLLVAIALLLVAVRGAGTTWIYGALVVLAVGRAFSAPANQSLLPQLVPREDFANAVTLGSTAFQVGTIVGPALGGGAYALGGAKAVYSLAVVLLAGSLATLASLTSQPPTGSARAPGAVLEGLRFVLSRPILLGALSLDLFAVLLGGAVALLPIFARDILEVGPAGLGALRAAQAVGAVAMAVWLSLRPIRRQAGRKMFAAVGVFGLAIIVFGLSASFWLSFGALVIAGAADELSVVVRQTLVQLDTPDDKRGRVSAVNFLFIGVSNEIGELESGLTAEWLGARRAAVLGGCGTLLVVALGQRLARTLYEADRLDQKPG